MLPLTLMGGSATELSVTGSCHDRGGDKVPCTLAELGTGQYCSVFESIPLRNEPGLAKAGMIITGSGDAPHSEGIAHGCRRTAITASLFALGAG